MKRVLEFSKCKINVEFLETGAGILKINVEFLKTDGVVFQEVVK